MTINYRGKNFLGNRTKCLLIQPKFFALSFWNYFDVCKITGSKYPATPLGLITAAALLPQQWNFKLIDENIEPLLDKHFEWADIVCTSGMWPQRERIRAIIEKAHLADCPVVVGGPDPTSNPDVYKSADYLVAGEGEITIPMFIDGLELGHRNGKYKSSEKADMTKAVVPRFDLLRFEDYIQVGIQYSRGCPFNCEFCNSIEIFGRKTRTKNPEQVIKELQTLYDLGYRGHIDFVDDNFIGNRKNVEETLFSIGEWYKTKNNPFYFSTETTLDLADETEILKMMRAIDFRYAYVGIESPEYEILISIGKKTNINRDISESLKKIQSYGITIFSSFIIGFDSESDRTAENIIKCIDDSGLCMVMLGKLEVLPNTQLTRRLKREGRLLENGKDNFTLNTDKEFCELRRDYWCCSCGLNFVTTRSRIDILKDYIKVLENIYSPENYFNRIITTCLNLKPDNNYKPDIYSILGLLISFIKTCLKLGFNRATGKFYWRVFFIVLTKNPKAIETAVTLSVMFIHFYNQSNLIMDTTYKEIKYIEKYGEDKYIKSILQNNYAE